MTEGCEARPVREGSLYGVSVYRIASLSIPVSKRSSRTSRTVPSGSGALAHHRLEGAIPDELRAFELRLRRREGRVLVAAPVGESSAEG